MLTVRAVLLSLILFRLATAAGLGLAPGESRFSTEATASTAGYQVPKPLTETQRRELLAARENVWRAWFANDRGQLEILIPDETIAINAGEEAWLNRAQVLATAKEFVDGGGKLLRLEFPHTEIQLYGDVAILYSRYVLEMENKGQRETQSGRGSEIFVRRGGRWVNSGWHLDSGR